MNRTGLLIALGVTAVFVAVYAIYPQLDLVVARQFFDESTRRFPASASTTLEFLRNMAMVIAWLFAAPAIVALAAKTIWPQKPLLISGRKMVFILVTIVLSAGVLTNVIFKQHWGRPRPAATADFSGTWAFKPWWDSSGACPRNCSFFSGEAATAFWTYAPASLAPPTIRPLAYAAATVFGLATGGLRMAFGGHYLSDVIVAGLVAFFVVWLTHGLLFRWRATRFSDEAVDRWLTDRLLASRQWLGDLRARMSDAFAASDDTSMRRAFGWLLVILLALTAFRILGLMLSRVDLFYDEAQYWAWAQTPDFGYFSKPPLLAWIIAATGKVCGSGEACVRVASPLLHLGTSLVIYVIARTLYGARAALWTALIFALGTGIVFSSRIISTDVPLVFCWAIALFAYVRLLDERHWRWAVTLGLAIGFGMLAKYAMAYFLLGVALAAWLDPRARDLIRHRMFWIAIGIAVLVLLPNLIWVATHDLATFRHTGDNIGASRGIGFHPVGALEFLASQFGVFGPVVFAVFLMALVRPLLANQPADRIMIAFAIPPIALVTINALLFHANANWAAPSAVSLTIVAVALLVRSGSMLWIKVTLAIGLFAQIVLPVADAFADRISLTFLSKPDIYARTIGWRALGDAVARTAASNGAAAIVADQRDVVSALIYYTRKTGLPVLSWRTSTAFTHQFDIDRPLTASAPEPLLYVTNCPWPARVEARFSTATPLPMITAPTGKHSSRAFLAYKLSGARGNDAPLGACAP